MSAASKYWRVTFRRDGTVRAVVALKGPGHARWVVVQAATESDAKRKARNLWISRLNRERKAEYLAAGKCSCGRALDGTLVESGRYQGQLRKNCANCRDRMDRVWRPRYAARVAEGTVGLGMMERDEATRLALNHERRRESRAELRLELLREVRHQWQHARTVGHFTRWLEDEIAAVAEKGKAA